MDLSFSAAEEAFRATVRSWLASHVPDRPLPSMDTAEGFEAHRRWERELFDERYSVVSWPAEFGGRGASITEWLIFEEEYWAAGAPGRVSQNGINLLAPSILDHGTAAQKERFLPSMASGEQIWAQVWSEPEAGSDLASLRSTAVRAPSDDGWLLSGHKTWSSRATFADWGFGLFRSDPAAERHDGARQGTGKHRGLTYFLFPLTAPGITVRPIPQFDGEPGFAELFFDAVYVPDADMLGAVGDGWKVAMATAGKERGLYLRSPGRFMATAARLVSLWREAGRPAEFRDRVADAWIGARAYRLATFETAARIADGGTLGAETSVNKVFWSELDLAMHETALDLLGPEAERLDSAWLDGYLFALAGPIYAGTNEVQRNVVAERVLGLPRGAR